MRSLSVPASGLSLEAEIDQFSLFHEENRVGRHTALERTMDKIWGKYGYHSIQCGIMLTDPALNLDAREDHVCWERVNYF